MRDISILHGEKDQYYQGVESQMNTKFQISFGVE